MPIRRLLSLLSLVLLVSVVTPWTWAQDFVWAKRLGGTARDQALGVGVDASGNVYSVGSFVGSVDFDPGPGTFNLTSAGDRDGYVCKLDSNGNLVWAKQIGGAVLDEAYGVAVDAGGNVYSVGTFAETADLDPGPATYNLTSAGSQDVFVFKLDSNGNFSWAKQMGGPAVNTDRASNVVVDAAGNVYSVGQFSGTADFDPGPGTLNLTTEAAFDTFVSKLDSNGNFVWAKQLVGSLVTHSLAFGVAVDAGGNVYTVGRFVGETDFDPGPGTFILPPMGGDDAFVWKLDSNGNFVWATTAGNAATGVAVDAGGNVYSVGEFVGTVDFDPGPGTFDLTSAGSEDAFVWKLDSNGSFVWAQRLGTGSSSDFARGVALDTIGGVYVVGILREWFIVRLGIDGNLLWTQELGGTPEGVAADASGNVYSVGFFTGTADFDPGPGTFNLTSAGDFDAFVEKFGGAPVPAGNVGDTLRIQHAAAGDVTLSWSGSCATTDDDFAIYEGVIGSWYSHIARFCGTGGATTATFTPSAGDTYYLLVPRNAVREGSYGAASNGTLRPQPSNACTVQQIAQPCP